MEIKKKIIKRFEFHVSYKCDNNCIFCSESEQLKSYKDGFVNLEIVRNVFKIYSSNGFEHVTLTGGEPSMHPEIFAILESAKECGLRVYIGTNGGRFSENEFCKKALPLISELSFSIHGNNEKTHNLQTGNKNSFNNITKALNNVAHYNNNKLNCFVNIVINKHNFEHLKDILIFVSNYKFIKQVLFSNLAPEGNGRKYYSNLAVKLSDLKLKIPDLTKICIEKAITPRFFGMPACLFSNDEVSNDYWWSPRLTLELCRDKEKVSLKKTLSKYPDRNRTKTDKCRFCSKKYCGGIFEEYLSLYGDSEISPIVDKS